MSEPWIDTVQMRGGPCDGLEVPICSIGSSAVVRIPYDFSIGFHYDHILTADYTRDGDFIRAYAT